MMITLFLRKPLACDVKQVETRTASGRENPLFRWFAFIVLTAVCSMQAMAASPKLVAASDAQIRATTAQTARAGGDNSGVVISVTTPGGKLRIALQPARKMRSSAGQWVAAVRDGQTGIYRGHVIQPEDGKVRAGSWARMTRIDGAWMGAIYLDDTDFWLVDRAVDHPSLGKWLGIPPDGSVVFRLSDIDGLEQIDHGGLAPPVGAMNAAPERATASASAHTYRLGVTLVLDTQFQALFGSAAESVAVGMLNVVDGIYSAQVDTEVYLHAMRSLASNGSLTSTDPVTLLDQFAWYSSHNLPFSGVAHLLSGREFNSTLIGYAWIGGPNYSPTLCNSYYGTGVEQMTFGAAGGAVELAHEIGHNYGALHDGAAADYSAGLPGNSCAPTGYIMAAGIDLTDTSAQFSTCSVNYMANYRSRGYIACLLPPDFIFKNGFEAL